MLKYGDVIKINRGRKMVGEVKTVKKLFWFNHSSGVSVQYVYFTDGTKVNVKHVDLVTASTQVWVTDLDLGKYVDASTKSVLRGVMSVIKEWAKNTENVNEVLLVSSLKLDNRSSSSNRALIVNTDNKSYAYKTVVRVVPTTEDDYWSSVRNEEYEVTSFVTLKKLNNNTGGNYKNEKVIYRKED